MAKKRWKPRDPVTGRFLSRLYCQEIEREVGDSITTRTAVELGVLAPDWYDDGDALADTSEPSQ
jgi:hypothetical protein